MDIKSISAFLDCGGEFDGTNRILNIPIGILSTNGDIASGKIIDITVVVDGNDKFFDMDLLFFPYNVTLESKPKDPFELSFDTMKDCNGRIQILSNDFSNIGKCSVANLFNLNMTFRFKELCLIAVYQSDKKTVINKNSIVINMGYELGSCS
jgi:hypothetical protein